MTSPLNLNQLENEIASTFKLIASLQAKKVTSTADHWPYLDSQIKTYSKQLKRYEEMLKSRRGRALYDFPIKELYKSNWPCEYNGVTHQSIIHSNDSIGIEIEYEGKNLHCTPIQYWTTHKEDSLREFEGHPPIEYVLIKPLDRVTVTKALDYLKARMKLCEASPVTSPRTSIHVHINAQNMTWKEIITWFAVYATVEDLLVEYSGKERIGNLFCLRTRDTYNLIQSFIEAVSREDYSKVTNADLRYTSMNFASVAKYGSVEFRSMRSPISFEDILKWIDILLAVKKSAAGFRDPREVVEYFESAGPKAMLNRIFEEPWMYDLFSHPELKRIMWDAVRDIKDVAYAIDWSGKVNKAKKGEENDAAEEGLMFHPSNPIFPLDADIDLD